MTVIDMQAARERRARRQEEAVLRRLRARIDDEKARARAEGLAWTPYRPFHSPLEAVGAMVCSACLGRGRSRLTSRAAAYVSYSTEMQARVSQCAWCHEGLGDVGDGLTGRMREVLAYAYDDDGTPTIAVPGNTRAGLVRRGLVRDGKLTKDGLAARRLLHEESRRRRPA